MLEHGARTEILDLLSRGKISIDEAVGLLDRSSTIENPEIRDEPLYKAETDRGFDSDDIVKIKLEKDFSTADDEPASSNKQYGSGQRPRWLKVQVLNNVTGKNKVTVNVPFAMVKFGLGIARVFSPEMKGVDFDEVNDLFSNAESGLLVDVQDDESNEHVKIFFE